MKTLVDYRRGKVCNVTKLHFFLCQINRSTFTNIGVARGVVSSPRGDCPNVYLEGFRKGSTQVKN